MGEIGNWELSEAAQGKVVSMGAEGLDWLARLNETIHGIELDWNIKVTKSLSGGSEAFVAEATDAEGRHCILKAAIPAMVGNGDFDDEMKAIAMADGKGYVRLYRYDAKARCALLEKLGMPLRDSGFSIDKQIAIICKTLVPTWIPMHGKENQFTGRDIFTEFQNLIQVLSDGENIRTPHCSILKAMELLSFRKSEYNPGKAVLVHGDAHSGNLLKADLAGDSAGDSDGDSAGDSDGDSAEDSYKLVDPDGIACEKEYDLGVLMREWPEEYLENPISAGRRRSELISGLTNADSRAIRQWGLIQCVSTGLLLRKVGQESQGLLLLDLADAWTDDAQVSPRVRIAGVHHGSGDTHAGTRKRVLKPGHEMI